MLLFLAPIPFFSLAIFVMGLAFTPAFWVGAQLWAEASVHQGFVSYFLKGVSVPLGFYIYGFSLFVVLPFFCFILGGRLKPYRGSPVSPKCTRWYLQATLHFIARYTFLEFVTPTPFLNVYLKLMGMKIGRHVHINSTRISDPSMITLKDYCTIGGSASIMAHYASGQFLVISPVIIGRKAVVGAGATLMGGVELGEGAKVLANSFVLPKTKIPAGETWGGVPALKLDLSSKESTVMGEVQE